VVVEQGGAEADRPLDLLVAGAADGGQVEVEAVLHRLGLGHLDEEEPRGGGRGLHDRGRVAGLVVVVHRPSEQLAPELRDVVRVAGGVHRDAVDLGMHADSISRRGAPPQAVNGTVGLLTPLPINLVGIVH
jgi:hypothetical protein